MSAGRAPQRGDAVPSGEQHTGEDSASRALLPPYLVLQDFLAEDNVAALLDYTLAREQTFQPTRVGRFEGGVSNPDVRVSLGMREFGEFGPILRSKLLAIVPDIVAQLQATPVAKPRIELELVAHNDGAFYKRHIDTQTAAERKDIRVISGVYYFHVEPKAFTGGALRLYAIGDQSGGTFVDIEPAQNTLLVFPSWAPHEVMPIRCPSGRFADSRFAINCWVHRSKTDAPAGGDGRGY
jgi:SM-20-related protein